MIECRGFVRSFLSLRQDKPKMQKIATLGESIPVVAIIFIFPPDWEQ